MKILKNKKQKTKTQASKPTVGFQPSVDKRIPRDALRSAVPAQKVPRSPVICIFVWEPLPPHLPGESGSPFEGHWLVLTTLSSKQDQAWPEKDHKKYSTCCRLKRFGKHTTALVIYCCLTGYPRTLWFKITFLTSILVGVRGLGWEGLTSLQTMSGRQSSQGAQVSASRFAYVVLAGFSSSRVAGLRASVLSWLLEGGCSRFLPCGPKGGAAHNMTSCFIREAEKSQRSVPRGKPQFFLEVWSHHCCRFHSLYKQVTTSRGGEYQQARIVWSHVRSNVWIWFGFWFQQTNCTETFRR